MFKYLFIILFILCIITGVALAKLGTGLDLGLGSGSSVVTGPALSQSHHLKIDGADNYLIIDGANHKLRIDGAS